MSERLTNETVEAVTSAIRSCVVMATIVTDEQMDAYMTTLRRQSSIMPILDPTEYIRTRQVVEDLEKVAEAFAEFRWVVRGLKTKVQEATE